MRLLTSLLCCFAAVSLFAGPTTMPAVIHVPPAAQPSAHFDPVAATDAYLAQIPPATMARSNAYFEGGYWLQLWEFLYGAVVALLFLTLGWSAKMRDFAERVTQRGPLRTAIYWVQYVIVVFILTLPLTIYSAWYRERQYGLATQTFGPWFTDRMKGLALSVVFGALLVAALFGIVRKLPRTWWIWGSIVTIAFLIFAQIFAPVYIWPLFNKVQRLTDASISGPILQMARANGIPAKDVWTIDASRQTTRMSANVSGFGTTMRITMNDNLLRRGSPAEIQAVLGHEMGHYVLDHIYSGIIYLGIVFVVWFALLQWSLKWALARWGERWHIRGVGDTAVLPLVILISAIYFFLMTPVLNTMVRTQEHEADMYGINASRQPDGFAQAAVHLGEYRKMSPGKLEEILFFDHPSGRNRILDAMRWKGENLSLFAAPPQTPK